MAKRVLSDEQVRLTLIDDRQSGKPTWSHRFVPKHLTVERGKLTLARSRGGRLWPSDLDDRSPANVEGMSVVVTWRDSTYSGRIATVKGSVAVVHRDRA